MVTTSPHQVTHQHDQAKALVMHRDARTDAPSRLSGEDLAFWWLDSPTQPTTMAMLILLDRPPDEEWLRVAFERAVVAVPRLAQRVVDAPLDLTLPRWELDPTFDLAYHVRRHALTHPGMDALLREIAPAYETAFDRSRPLWEARVYDGVGANGEAALFFKLHHSVADGVGANAIFAALTDAERVPAYGGGDAWEPGDLGEIVHAHAGAWPPPRPLGLRLLEALRDRVALDAGRAASVGGVLLDTVRHPANAARALQIVRSTIDALRFDSGSPLKDATGRARRLSVLSLPFDELRRVKRALGGTMIDVILTIMAQAIGRWHEAHGLSAIRELMTLVPVNLRTPEEWATKAQVGNVATGILVPLPIHMRSVRATFDEIRARMDAKKADPASRATPAITEVLSVLPRGVLTWMAEATFGSVDFIVTNVPGILVPRYLAGSELVAAYPFAPIAMKSPVSVALYGYRDQLFIGINSDEATMPDVELFQAMIRTAHWELRAVASGAAS